MGHSRLDQCSQEQKEETNGPEEHTRSWLKKKTKENLPSHAAKTAFGSWFQKDWSRRWKISPNLSTSNGSKKPLNRKKRKKQLKTTTPSLMNKKRLSRTTKRTTSLLPINKNTSRPSSHLRLENCLVRIQSWVENWLSKRKKRKLLHQMKNPWWCLNQKPKNGRKSWTHSLIKE